MAIVEVQGLRKTYGAVTAVDDVSFTVAEGEVFGTIRVAGLDPSAGTTR